MRTIRSLRAMVGRLRIGSQLRLAFATVLVLTSALGAASLLGLQRMDAQAHTLADKWLVGVGHLAETRAMLVTARELETKHSRTNDESYQTEYEDKLKEAWAGVTQHTKAYESLVAGEDEQKQFAAVNKTLESYRKAQQQVLAAGRAKKQQDAADISDGLASMSFDESIGALGKLSQLNFAGGAKASEHASQVFAQSRWFVIGMLCVSLLAGVGLSLLITRNLLRQLGGEPATAVAVARAVAEGDLTTHIELRAGDERSLMARLQAMQRALAEAVANVRNSSDFVATASTQIAQGNQDLSTRTEQQASALQETAATMEQLGQTVHGNAENAHQASQLAEGASSVAARGGAVVGEVVATMKGINDSSRKIADIIAVIDGIAFQTNILALNAAVEAARAGEQGRGFAVVAGEVRSLAQRSAEAAREIRALIMASVERVEHGSALVDRAGHTMNEVVASIRRVSDIVNEISSASGEQSNGVAQVGQAITRMDRTTQENAALVEQSAAAADSLKQQAQQLVRAVAVFKLVTNQPAEQPSGQALTRRHAA